MRSRLGHRKNSKNHNFVKMEGQAGMKSYQLILIGITVGIKIFIDEKGLVRDQFE
jgi:hypothetical protein